MSTDPQPGPRDAAEVGASTARVAWAEAARPVLLEAAGRYRGLVRWKQLGEAVQASTGMTTTRPVATWVGGVLALVGDDCSSRGEPLLPALCVNVQGSVGEAYADTVERARGSRPPDPDEHAAEERLACYRHFDAVGLPRDGGTPLRTAHFTPARKTPARPPAERAARPRTTTPRTTTSRTPRASAPKPAAPEPKPIRLCPTCFTAVPASGICDYCD